MFKLTETLLVKSNLFKHPVLSMAKLVNNGRCFSTSTEQYEEIKIPWTCGDIAGKWWGPQDKRPILGIHGWQDNSGTFDRLAPLLPQDVAFLAIDLPGHGLSTRLPHGIFYHGIDIVMFIKRIIDYFNWPKVSLLGHSMGAMSSFTYTMLYPESVDFLICLDGLYPLTMEKHAKPEVMAKTINDFLKYDALNNSAGEPPSYTFTQLEQLLHKGSRQSIDIETCKYILRRNIAPSTKNPDQFYFARDPRLKVPSLLQWTDEGINEGCSRVTCPLFFSLGESSPFLFFKEDYMKKLDIIEKQNNNVEYHEVEGTHHLHLNTPENIQALVNAFIEKYDVGDRTNGGMKKEMILS